MADEAGNSRDEARCIECMAHIPPGATKCSNCGSSQNWKRYLSLSTVVLSLLVALISVTTVGVSVFKEVILPMRAKVNVHVLYQSNMLDFQLIVSNTGNAPGLISRIYRPIVIDGEDRFPTLNPSISGRKQSWPMELPANSFKVIDVEGHLMSAPDEIATEKKFGCMIKFWVIQATGLEPVKAVSCEDFGDVLN